MSRKEREDEELPAVKRLKAEQNQNADEDKDKHDDEGSGDAAEIKMEDSAGTGGKNGQESKMGDKGYSMLSQVKEEDVGITEYISDHKGVSAIIKQRYSDFIVNEISSSGEVVHLTTTDVPVVIEESEPNGPVDSVLPEDFLAQLKQVASGSVPGLAASLPVGDDKEKRLHIHRAVKAAFANVETKTEEKDGQKVITAMLRDSGKDTRRNKGFEWPKSKKSSHYCRFVLYKENKGTMDVVHLIARYLRVKDSLFQYAGTKDRRGKTTQEVTAYRIHPKKLQDLNKFLRNITLGNFRYVDTPLRLGALGGNKFTIVLRNVLGDDHDIETGLNSLKNNGFINYYGLQRFGTLSVCTHQVGRALLSENWEEAVNLIISGTGKERQAFRKVWQTTKDPRKTLELVENKHFIERVVLRSLVKRPTQFLNAVQSLPHNTRLIYPHSYQSVVWNSIVSRRIKTFGLKPIVGDLVLPPGAAADTEPSDVEIAEGENIVQGLEMEQDAKDQDIKDQDPKDQDSKDQDPKDPDGKDQDPKDPDGKDQDPKDPDGKDPDPKGKKSTWVKPLVLDETTVSQYTIYDVVYPLPGFDVAYPNNEVRTWYQELLQKDGFDIDNLQRKQKDFSLPGGYRAVIVRPEDVEWTTFLYNDTTMTLALSDTDRLQGVDEPEGIPNGKMKAIRLSFTLTTSSYATMALREVLKTDTSPAQQASMNVT